MPTRSHDARHRVSRKATAAPRGVIAGLALPTAAAVALMFTATGAAVATSPKSVSPAGNASAISHTAASSALRSGIDPNETPARRHQAVEDQMAVDRTHAAARVARSTARKALVVRALAAKRAAVAHSWRLPITNPVQTSGFGYRWGRLHAGEDYGVPVGTNLASMSTGTVVFAGVESGYGNLVQIRYWDGTISYFAHMSSISVSVGTAVDPGRVVGQSGNTGHSTGPHLHLEIHPDGGPAINPLPWLASHNIVS